MLLKASVPILVPLRLFVWISKITFGSKSVKTYEIDSLNKRKKFNLVDVVLIWFWCLQCLMPIVLMCLFRPQWHDVIISTSWRCFVLFNPIMKFETFRLGCSTIILLWNCSMVFRKGIKGSGLWIPYLMLSYFRMCVSHGLHYLHRASWLSKHI